MSYKTYEPSLRYVIVTYELDEESNVWIETLTHIFVGDTIEEIQEIIAAHKKTDAFFSGGFLGQWKDIKLKNEVLGLI